MILNLLVFQVKPPKKYPTPHGGRLVWVLPGKTKIVCHLKDKDLIRHKKRWSQCMYMYYLLGFKLMELPISTIRKEVISQNTYILALDGDIDFQPNAITRLVDLMKKNKKLGAACGRIHPTGKTIILHLRYTMSALCIQGQSKKAKKKGLLLSKSCRK